MSSMDVPADRPVDVPAAKVAMVRPTYITWLTLAFMTTASVASLRSAPTMAVYGLTCVFLYIVPAIVFLLPQSLVAAELASGRTGGVFRWVSEGISAIGRRSRPPAIYTRANGATANHRRRQAMSLFTRPSSA